MAAAAAFSTSCRFFRSTATTAGNTEGLVPLARIRSLARAGRLADIDAALAPLLPDHPAAALSALSSVGLPDRASAILGTIASPTAQHLNALLAPLLRRRRLARLVPSLLDAHPSAPRDAATDCILAKSLCLTSGADSAVHLLQGQGRSSPPSLQLYTTLMDSYYKQHKPHRAEELWRAMVGDHGIAPDAVAYNVRIAYKSRNGTVEEVKELIRAMREDAGLRPDAVSYNMLMRALVRHGKVDEAVEVYRSLQDPEAEGEGSTEKEANPAPECATYSCVVGALCGAGRWSEAEDVFYEGVKRRKVADLDTVRTLVRGLKDAGKGRAARRVVVGLRKKFPDHFDGPWRELYEAAVLLPSGKEGKDDGDEQPAQQVTATAAAA